MCSDCLIPLKNAQAGKKRSQADGPGGKVRRNLKGGNDGKDWRPGMEGEKESDVSQCEMNNERCIGGD